jgi:predicted metal-dependent TIM-barrel fold hydrolase
VKIFDAQIRSDTRPDSDLQNLQYFDTEHVITTAHNAEAFERADDIINYFSRLTSEELTRLERFGLKAHIALGVLPSARPERAYAEVWHDLPYLIKQPEVIALGEIGAWRDHSDHWELFERQVEIGLAYDGPMPLIVTPPKEFRVNMICKMMDRLNSMGYPPDQVMINRVGFELIETVLHEGFCAGISVGASNLPPRETATVIADVIEARGSPQRIIFNTSLSAGTADVLGIPKTVVELREIGVNPRIIEKLIYGNAKACFLREQHSIQ